MTVSIKCSKCEKLLTSKSVHDFVQCKCSAKTFVDGGGIYYCRYGGFPLVNDKGDALLYDVKGNQILNNEIKPKKELSGETLGGPPRNKTKPRLVEDENG